MKKFIKEYINIFALTITGVVFILASFNLIMNYNHSEELKKTIYIGENDVYYKNYQETLASINSNIISYRSKGIKNGAYRNMADSLTNCYSILQDRGTFGNIKVNVNYNAYDVYNLGSKYQSSVINSCWATNLTSLHSNDVPEEFKDIAPVIVSYVNTINDNVSDALSELENNSSYFYTTNIATTTVRNYLGSDYKTIAKSYNDFASIILYLSNYINDNGGNNNA